MRSLERTDLSLLEEFLDDAGERKAVAIVVFPRARTAGDLIDIVRKLSTHSRWSVVSKAYGLASAGCAAIELLWKTSNGNSSSAMGFAPLGEMPVTRRSPNVALALWTGGRDNPFFALGPKGRVNMAHATHGLTDTQHTATWAKTVADVAAMFVDPREDADALHTISFCVASDAIAPLAE